MNELSFLEDLVKCFEKLPGVGKKTALRYAYFIIEHLDNDDVKEFSNTLIKTKEETKKCKICGMLTNQDECSICSDPNRDMSKIIVVKDSKDALAIEKIKQYNGLYHILGGLISPLDGVGPDDINISSLEKRVKDTSVKEVILATPFTPSGETTAIFLEKILQRDNLIISRIGYGIPAGGDIEYTDELTLMKSLQGRKTL